MPPALKETEELEPAQAAGLTLGAVALAGLLGLFIWYQTRRRRLRRKLGHILSSPRFNARDGGAGDGTAENRSQADVLRDAPRKEEPSVAVLAVPSRPHHTLYMDDKIELPVPKAMRTRTRDSERDFYDGSPFAAPGGMVQKWEEDESKTRIGAGDFDGDKLPRGPFELPGMPASSATRNDSWRTGASSLFHHRPLPRYTKAEGGERRSLTPPPPPVPAKTASRQEMAVSPLSVGMNRGTSPGGESEAPRDGEVSPLTPAPLVPRDRKQSLNGILEEQAGGGEGLKETVTAEEKTEMLNNDKWLTWRRFGGGAGTG